MKYSITSPKELKFEIQLKRGDFAAIRDSKTGKVFKIKRVSLLDPLLSLYACWVHALSDDWVEANPVVGTFWIGGDGALFHAVERGEVEMILK